MPGKLILPLSSVVHKPQKFFLFQPCTVGSSLSFASLPVFCSGKNVFVTQGNLPLKHKRGGTRMVWTRMVFFFVPSGNVTVPESCVQRKGEEEFQPLGWHNGEDNLCDTHKQVARNLIIGRPSDCAQACSCKNCQDEAQHVANLWNSLPPEVVMACGIDAFIRGLDRFLDEKSITSCDK